jgi:hypothetical protein
MRGRAVLATVVGASAPLFDTKTTKSTKTTKGCAGAFVVLASLVVLVFE